MKLLALLGTCAIALAQTPKSPQYPGLLSETPDSFRSTDYNYDHDRREVMIPMRDGVKLFTVVVVPKGARNTPILITRTPYDAKGRTTGNPSIDMRTATPGFADVTVDGGYIRVYQDVRGKHKSEGDYVMNRPMRGPLNPTPVDHATDTYDTIEWLVKNVPESNGKVGILGVSYDGFTSLTALFSPHPALKVAVPMNPMVDGWMGDDWFHNGAFRQANLQYIYNQQATRANDVKWYTSHYDEYDMFLQAGSAGELGRRRGMDQIGFFNKLTEHPAYDSWWQAQAMDKLLAKEGLKVPTMLVHSLWDQEDIYGDIAVYKLLEPQDTRNDKLFLVMGPWNHGGESRDGSSLGAIRFDSDTGLYFRKYILRPFLDQYLKDGAPKSNVAPVMAFESGSNEWRRYDKWPLAGGTKLYLQPGQKLAFQAPSAAAEKYTEYVSDPAKPVSFRLRPNRPLGSPEWPTWLVADQREYATRPDVVSFTSDVLTQPLKIGGQPVVNLIASTSGTDSDWVVKLIDVYPDQYASDPAMGGFQLMVSADILRGRYRESFEVARAITPDKPLLYKWELPTANHVFLPGHRVMVQIQSTWFPLYDRNPQTFVPNIFWAKPEDFRKATQRVYHEPANATFLELPVVRR